jgi:hypothetical protein
MSLIEPHRKKIVSNRFPCRCRDQHSSIVEIGHLCIALAR